MRDWIKRLVVDPIFYGALFAFIAVVHFLSVLHSRLLCELEGRVIRLHQMKRRPRGLSKFET